MKNRLLLFVALIGIGLHASAHDFSAVSPSGHTLYYKVYSNNIVGLVCPCDTATLWANVWTGYSKPVGNVVVPDSVQYGGQWFRVLLSYNGAFFGCSAITSITLPTRFQVISRYTFNGCTALANIDFRNTIIHTIGREAFGSCTNLRKVMLPDSLRVIDTLLFYGCTNLKVVSIPANVTRIRAHAFRESGILDTLYFNAKDCTTDMFTYYNSTAWDGIPRSYQNHYLRANHLIVGDSVRYIREKIFGTCVAGSTNIADYIQPIFESITIGPNVQSIGDQAFYSGYGFVTREDVTQGANINHNPNGRVVTFKCLNPLGGLHPDYSNTRYPFHVPCGTAAAYASAYGTDISNMEEADTPIFSASSSNETQGSVYILTTPTCSSPTAVVTAVPAAGFRFDHWSDGSTQNPYSLSVNCDTEIIAYFASDGGTTGIDDATQEGITLAILGTTLTIQGAEGETSVVTDLMGRTLYSGNTTSRIELPASGTYFVRVGNRPARKVVALR